ncbi:phage tail tape measure protein [Sphingobium yanoikuyae]|uniref:phage tail tape measure protein n=1 Tax=Sphingobium yanoikuyae TaxID=13690 RepID=UPI002FDCD799
MNNKLSLLVNFIGVDKMSGALKNIVGLGKSGSKSLRALTGEAKKLEQEIAEYDRRISRTSGKANALWDQQKQKMIELEQVQESINRQQRLMAINADKAATQRRGRELKDSGRDSIVGAAVNAIPLIAAAKQAMTFEAAMADVRKVVDFPTPKAYAQMGSDILTLSTRIPMAAEGIAAIVAAAGRANIPRKELLRFAEDAAKMGVAFDMTGDEAGGMMAKWRTAFSLGQADVVRLSDQVNALTNTYGGNATAVAGVITRIGALGGVAGVSASQVGAMAQLLNSVGVEEEVAATGIKNMMLALTKGTSATKSQEAVLKTLGLTATDLAGRMQKDAGGAITDVLQRLSKVPKAAQAGMLTDLFGSESVGAISPMLVNLDKLQANFTLVGNKAAYAGSMNKEYLAAVATTEGATGLALNSLKALNIEIGTTMLPAITSAAQSVRGMVLSMRDWAQANPSLTSGIVTTLSALIGLRMGLGVLKFAFGGILGPFGTTIAFFRKVDGVSKFGTLITTTGGILKKAAPAFSMLRTAALFMGRGFMSAGAMMLANPIPLIIAGIVVALGFAAYLAYTHWDKISGAFKAGVALVKGAIGGLPDWMRNIGSMMMQGLLFAINPMALGKKLIDMAKYGIQQFKAYLGIKSPSRVFMALGGHVAGGLERGIDGNRHGPARAAGRMAAGVAAAGALAMAAPAVGARRPAATSTAAAPTAPITIQVYAAPGMDVKELAREVRRELAAAKGRQERSSYDDGR